MAVINTSARLSKPSQFLKENPWGNLRRRRNISPVTNICEAAPISVFWVPNGVNELPEMRSKFSSDLIGKLTMAFFQANHGAYSNPGREVESCCLAY